MKFRRRRGTSSNIQDRRGGPGMALGAGGGVAGLIIVVLFMLLGGGDGGGGPATGEIEDILGRLQNPAAPGEGPGPGPDPDDRLVDFMSFVLDDSQRFWARTFEDAGEQYRDAKLVLFTRSTHSACGGATAAI